MEPLVHHDESPPRKLIKAPFTRYRAGPSLRIAKASRNYLLLVVAALLASLARDDEAKPRPVQNNADQDRCDAPQKEPADYKGCKQRRQHLNPRVGPVPTGWPYLKSEVAANSAHG